MSWSWYIINKKLSFFIRASWINPISLLGFFEATRLDLLPKVEALRKTPIRMGYPTIQLVKGAS